MIAYLSWEIIDLDSNKLVLLTNGGVGYEIWISDITYSNLNLWAEISFHIYHHKTENSESLFWFLEKTEKQIFEELIKISWVGWKVAIQILSLWVNTLSSAINSSDNKMIESVKWIWKKMAEKIILELKDKDFIKTSAQVSTFKKEGVEQSIKIERNLYEDIISTFTNMWYDKKSIEKALTKISPELSTMEDIIPAVIKEI